jgi:outer membrane protein insertion porin family
MRLKLAVVLLFVTTFLAFGDDWYQGKPIRRIVFDGLVNVSAFELDGITGPFVNRNFTDDIFWDILGRLYALEYFESITSSAVMADPAGNEVILRFSVVERPTVSRINFVGNRGIRRTDLLETILLRDGDVATQIRLRMDEQAIINRYQERGFPDVRVRSEIQSSGRSTVAVIFHIEEGEKIAIESFHFEGNSIFSSRTLQRQLSLRTRGIFQDGAFHEARLIADRHALAQFYHDRGYIDAHVVDVVQEIRRDERGNNLMTITFKIYEGRLYTFGGVTFQGNRIFSDEQLSALIQSRVGDTVNARRIQADLMRVSSLYFENGYIFNRIEPVPIQDPETGLLSFNMVITERGRAHIENIIVRGNLKTRDSVILREIPLQVGDVFSQAKVMDGLRNLYNLQFFSAITPETPPGSADSLMDLIINVEEQLTMELMFGFNFSGSADPDTIPISAMARWNDRNFLGSGNTIGAEVNAGFDTQSVSGLYTHRWVFGLPFSASFDLTFQHTRRTAAMNNTAPFFHGDEPFAFPDGFNSFEEYENAFKIPPDQFLMLYNQWRVSLGVGSGYRWNTFLGSLGLGGGFRVGMVYNSFDSERFRPFDPVLRERNNTWTPALSVWATGSLDRRDVFFDPSSGYYAFQRVSWHGIIPSEQEHYIRTDTRLQWFYTLFDLPVLDNWNFKAVFGIHTGLSFIFPKPMYDQPYILEASQLAVDGMFIGRGWTSEFRRKGFALWENWAEIRVPLAPGILAWDFFLDAAGIKRTPAALFTDFFADDGSLSDSNTFFMRFSLGGGFRFTIPQFPFRFSLARRFLYRDGKLDWVSGGLGGWDFVVSFALATF